MVVFFILTNYDHVDTHNLEYEKNDQSLFFYGFTHVFRLEILKHAFKRIKKRNLSVSCSQSGAAIVSETRSVFLDFTHFSVRLNAFLKNLVCLGMV